MITVTAASLHWQDRYRIGNDELAAESFASVAHVLVYTARRRIAGRVPLRALGTCP